MFIPHSPLMYAYVSDNRVLPLPHLLSRRRHQYLLVGFLLVGNFIVSRAYRASRPLVPAGAVIDRRAPDVPFRADPPDAPVAARCYLLGRQCAVHLRVPLCRYLRAYGGEIVKALQHLLPSTVGTAVGSSRPIYHLGTPRMAQMALPPGIAVAARHNLAWGQRPVLGGVPLGSDSRVQGLQVIVARQRHIVGADGAVCPLLDTG